MAPALVTRIAVANVDPNAAALFIEVANDDGSYESIRLILDPKVIRQHRPDVVAASVRSMLSPAVQNIVRPSDMQKAVAAMAQPSASVGRYAQATPSGRGAVAVTQPQRPVAGGAKAQPPLQLPSTSDLTTSRDEPGAAAPLARPQARQVATSEDVSSTVRPSVVPPAGPANTAGASAGASNPAVVPAPVPTPAAPAPVGAAAPPPAAPGRDDQAMAILSTVPEDLQAARPAALQAAKARMDVVFEQRRLRPGDPGFEYDRRADFQEATEASDWDD